MDRARQLLVDPEAQGADPGAGVEDYQRVVVETELHAGRVPTVTDRFRARRGQRSSAPPDPGSHLSTVPFPEDRHRAHELVGPGEQGEGRDGDLSPDVVATGDREGAVSGDLLGQG